jgi:hypothetical protein
VNAADNQIATSAQVDWLSSCVLTRILYRSFRPSCKIGPELLKGGVALEVGVQSLALQLRYLRSVHPEGRAPSLVRHHVRQFVGREAEAPVSAAQGVSWRRAEAR